MNNYISKSSVKAFAIRFDEDFIGALFSDTDTRESFSPVYSVLDI